MPMVAGPHAHVRVWFRGQSKAGWPLQPAVYRQGFPAANETDRLRVEQHLAQDFRVESAGLLTGRETEAELYFLEQHYGLPTRLLDWTHNPLPALFFATDLPSDDGELFVMDAFQMNTPEHPDFGVATSRHRVFVKAMEVISRWGNINDFPGFIIPVRPDYIDRRVTFQHSCFTFHVPTTATLTNAENPSLWSFTIPAAAKAKIRSQLKLLGVDQFSIFGDLENLAKRLKAARQIP
jgi:FRG domain